MKASAKRITKRKVQKKTSPLPLSMKSGAKSYFQEEGAESQNFKEAMEGAKRCCNAPSK